MNIIRVIQNSFKLLHSNPKLTLPFVLNQFLLYSLLFVLSILGITTSSNYILNNLEKILISSSIILIVWMIFSVILSCWGYYQNTCYVEKKNNSFKKTFLDSQKYFLKLLLIRIVSLTIVLVPIMIIMVISLYSITLHTKFGILLSIMNALIIVLWIFLISIKLFYAEIQLFVDKKINHSTYNNIYQAYNFSKGNNTTIIILLLLILSIHIFANSILSNPAINQILEFIKAYKLILYYTFGLLFLIIASIITGATSTFTNLMMIRSYLELKKRSKK